MFFADVSGHGEMHATTSLHKILYIRIIFIYGFFFYFVFILCFFKFVLGKLFRVKII